MTAMPQMVAMFNGMGGGAAALIALGDFHRLTLGGVALGPIDSGTILLSCLIGSISFAGSMIAFAKLQELMTGTPITWPFQHEINGVLLRRPGRHRARDHDHGRRRRADDRLLHRRPGPRGDGGPAGGRRRHAGDHLAAELLHRSGRGGDRLRDRQLLAGGGRCPGRRLGLHPHRADEQGHEPAHHQRPLRRLRSRWRGGAGGRRRWRRARPSVRPAPRTWRCCSPTPSR